MVELLAVGAEAPTVRVDGTASGPTGPWARPYWDASEKATARLLWESARVYPRRDVVVEAVAARPDADRLVSLALAHGLGSMLWRAMRIANQRGALGRQGDRLAREAALRRAEAILLIPHGVGLSAGVLTEAGLEPVVFKGPALAARYPEPGLRPMVDIDLLLPVRHHSQAIRVLGDAGWRVARPRDRRHYDTALVHHRVPDLCLELHGGLDNWWERSNGIRLSGLWDRRVPVDCYGTATFGLPPEVELVALAAHAAKPFHCFSRLIWATDLAVVLGEHPDCFDWHTVRELADVWRCRNVLRVGLGQARRLGAACPDDLGRLNGSVLRRACLQPLVEEDWPLCPLDPGIRRRARYALVDDPARQAVLFLGSPTPETPLRSWPRVYAVDIRLAVRQLFRLWRAGAPDGRARRLGAASGLAKRAWATTGWRERWQIVRICVLLMVAEMAVRSLPLSAAARLFGLSVGTESGPATTVWLDERETGVLDLAHRVGGRWPLGRGPCLRRSLVEGHLLRRHHPTLRLGVRHGDAGLEAHAWVEVGGMAFDQRGFAALEALRGPQLAAHFDIGNTAG